MTVLLFLSLLSQWGWWGPGIDADFLQGKDTLGVWVHSGTDSSTRGVRDTTVSGIWRSKTSVVTGAGSAAFGVSCTTGAARGATVSGGIANVANADSAFVGGGGRNRATALAAVVGGGINNTASGVTSIVAGGANNTASAYAAIIGGGGANQVTGDASYGTIAGGNLNSLSGGGYPTIGGGCTNLGRGAYSTIPGGFANVCSSYCGVALGDSNRNRATDTASVLIGGGYGTGRNVSQGKFTVSWGWKGLNQTAWGIDSTVTQPGVDLIVHGPAKVDSAFTLTGIKIDSFRVAADTSTFTIWIGPHSFTIPED